MVLSPGISSYGYCQLLYFIPPTDSLYQVYPRYDTEDGATFGNNHEETGAVHEHLHGRSLDRFRRADCKGLHVQDVSDQSVLTDKRVPGGEYREYLRISDYAHQLAVLVYDGYAVIMMGQEQVYEIGYGLVLGYGQRTTGHDILHPAGQVGLLVSLLHNEFSLDVRFPSLDDRVPGTRRADNLKEQRSSCNDTDRHDPEFHARMPVLPTSEGYHGLD